MACSGVHVLSSLLLLFGFTEESYGKSKNFPPFCEVLFSNLSDCPAPLFIRGNLICFVGENKLPRPPTPKAARINKSKILKISECESWVRISFIRLHKQKCIQGSPAVSDRDKSAGQSGLITEIVQAGYQALVIYNDNITLHKACEEGKLGVVQYILSRGLENIDCRGKWGRTPVMAAVRKGQLVIFRFLLSLNCSLSTVDEHSDNVLHVACKGGNIDIVMILTIKYGLDIQSKGFRGRTPAMTAAFFGHRSVIDFLVSKGCNLRTLENSGNNILHVACFGGHVDMVRYIMSKNITGIESRGYNGRTPIMMAAKIGRIEVFKFLMKKGCNLIAVDKYKNNILHVACIGSRIETVKYILAHDLFDIDSRGYNGLTPSMTAAKYGHKRLVEYFVSKGCDLAALDHYKSSILHWACINGDVSLVKYTLSLQVFEIDSKGFRGRTPVMLAVEKGHQRVVQLLVSRGCNTKTIDNGGNTLLHVACIGGHVDMVKYLIELGSGSDWKEMENNSGHTPIQVAKFKGHREIISYFNELMYDN